MSDRSLAIPVRTEGGEVCGRCAEAVARAVASVPGVTAASVAAGWGEVHVTFDPQAASRAALMDHADSIARQLRANASHCTVELAGVDCPDCLRTIERSVAAVPGVRWVAGSIASGLMTVETDPGAVSREQLIAVAAGHSGGGSRIQLGPRAIALWSSLLAALSLCLEWVGHPYAGIVAALAAILVGGRGTFLGALAALRTRTTDMAVLMSVAILGAAALGDWQEAAAVAALFSTGLWLQSRSMDRTREAIHDLISLAPATALVRHVDGDRECPVGEVTAGATMVVPPGGRIPLDGIVLAGASDIDEAAITGEALPRARGVGDHVFAGSLNGPGELLVQVTHAHAETMIARILRTVEHAAESRTTPEQWINRFAAIYTPAVLSLAGAVVLAALVRAGLAGTLHLPEVRAALLRGLTLIVTACPCALVLSTPVAVVSAVGAASRHGILVRGGAYLEALASARVVFLDKTGTLTTGEPRLVSSQVRSGADAGAAMAAAAALGRASGHPLGRAIEAATPTGQAVATCVRVEGGTGVRGVVDGIEYALGRPGISLGDQGPASVDEAPARDEGTVSVLVDHRGILARLEFEDAVRPEAASVVAGLKGLGVGRVVMLTGDSERAARRVADSVGITDRRARMLPDQKAAAVAAAAGAGNVVMVGDGINDAPALAEANVGVAMGAAASDVAVETASIAVMGNDLGRLVDAMRIGRAMLAAIRRNVVFVLATKLALVAAASVTGIPMWLAVVGDVGVSLVVVLHSCVLLRYRSDET